MTSRLPLVRDGVLVIESDGGTCRALGITRALGAVRVDAVETEDASPSLASLAALLGRLRTPQRAVIVVTSEARPEVCFGRGRPEDLLRAQAARAPGDVARGWAVSPRPAPGAEARCLVTSLPRERGVWWARTLAQLGLCLEGIYPLLGTALIGIREDGQPQPRLVLQLERSSLAVIEAVASSCSSLECYEEPPSVKRCAELIGEGCPEVSLCGGGVNLSEFGYELVRDGRTWARLPPLCSTGASLPGSFAAMVGAARHACGLAPRDAIACIPAVEL